MNRLEQLRAANPGISIYDVRSEEFRCYGNLIGEDTGDICKQTKTWLTMPESGSVYTAALEPLDTSAWAEMLREKYCGGLDEQAGVCYGHSNQLNALEWHTCAEFNVAVTDMVLLLAKKSDLETGNRLDSKAVKAFYLQEGDMVEVSSDTLHFCPCEVSRSGFISIVGLQRGTNLPLTEKERKGLLWAKNKWLISHEENTVLVNRGGFPGIYGENWRIHTID